MENSNSDQIALCHPLLQKTAEQIASAPSEAEKMQCINRALLDAAGEGFKAGVRAAGGQVQNEIRQARSRTAISCYDQARKMAEERADLARQAGDVTGAIVLERLVQTFGDLTAVIEKEQRKPH